MNECYFTFLSCTQLKISCRKIVFCSCRGGKKEKQTREFWSNNNNKKKWNDPERKKKTLWKTRKCFIYTYILLWKLWWIVSCTPLSRSHSVNFNEADVKVSKPGAKEEYLTWHLRNPLHFRLIKILLIGSDGTEPPRRTAPAVLVLRFLSVLNMKIAMRSGGSATFNESPGCLSGEIESKYARGRLD